MYRLGATPFIVRAAHTSLFGVLTAAAVLTGCKGGSDSVAPGSSMEMGASKPAFTASSGSSSTLLARATFTDPSDPVFKVKRITGDWHMEL
jgi:hypothetical protein